MEYDTNLKKNIKDKIVSELAKAKDALESMGADEDNVEEMSSDVLDQASITRNKAERQGQRTRLEKMIKDLNFALERIDLDDYGFCADCGDEIEYKRLMILPATRFCVNCAQH